MEISSDVRLSRHAGVRSQERRAPDWVLAKIRERTFIAQARSENGRITRHHIVRVGRRRYWVGIEREGVVATVVPVAWRAHARIWFGRRLLNHRVMMRAIERMPITEPPAPEADVAEPARTEVLSRTRPMPVQQKQAPRVPKPRGRTLREQVTEELAAHYGVPLEAATT